MISFFSIVKLTWRSAIRSHIFQLLLVVLTAFVIILPLTIAGDGTAYGYIQVSLKYNLSVVAFILSMSTIWLACSVMTQDMESYQLHMIVSKPVSRMKVWLGKCTGVLLINSFLLLISCSVIYGIVVWQFNRSHFPADEKKKIENEVMTARRVFYPQLPNINAMAREEYAKRLAAAKTSSAKGEREDVALREMRRQIIAKMSELPVSASKIWFYKNLPVDLKAPLYLRYRAYVDKISSKDQRETYGIWHVAVTRKPDEKTSKTDVVGPVKVTEPVTYWEPRSYYPEKMMCGVFNEITLNPAVIAPDGTVNISFTNLDQSGKNLHFQVPDGPKMLIRVAGFFENYTRASFLILLQLIILTGLACAASSVLSMPTAIFMVVAYLLFGTFSTFLVGAGIDVPDLGLTDYFAYYMSIILLWLVIPLQVFDMSGLVSAGELIEFSLMAKIFFKFLVVKGLPLFLLGIWLYRRREMGLVIRK
ncbi:MAG: hypothetical protein A2020_15545 [Lentisphaerae bacterium GWF2_45_14]|nr:MAG: hypothetical protein A2020_15545 [Lentisphaerae bacterium GWF2_45_14]